MGYFNEGKYSAAINVFETLVDEFGENAHHGEVAYYLGLSLFNVMRFGESARYLEISMRDSASEYYEVALMHLAVCHYFLRDYSKAIDGFMFLAGARMESDLKPYALLMLAKCYREKGELEEAERYFMEVKNEYVGTEFSDTATEELQSLRAH
jgi:TolA-binding protein